MSQWAQLPVFERLSSHTAGPQNFPCHTLALVPPDQSSGWNPAPLTVDQEVLKSATCHIQGHKPELETGPALRKPSLGLRAEIRAPLYPRLISLGPSAGSSEDSLTLAPAAPKSTQTCQPLCLTSCLPDNLQILKCTR